MEEFLSLLDNVSKRRVAGLSGIRASAPIMNTLLVQAMNRPATPERFLGNLLLEISQNIPKRLEEERVLEYLAQNRTPLPEDVLALPDKYKTNLLSSAFDQAKQQQLQALKPLIFDENTLNEIATELSIPVELVKEIAKQNPERVFQALSQLRLRREMKQKQMQSLTNVPTEILNRYGELFGVNAEELRPLLEDPEIGKNLIQQALRLESALALENVKQRNREETIDRRSLTKRFEKAQEAIKQADTILELATSPANQAIVQEAPYSILNIPQGDFKTLANMVKVDDKPLSIKIKEIAQKIDEKKYGYSDVVKLGAYEVFKSLLTNDPRKRITINDLYDKINETIEKLRPGLTSKKELTPEDYSAIARDITNELGRYFASATGSVAPREIAARLRELFGDQGDSLVAYLIEGVDSANFSKVKDAFSVMIGAISEKEFEALFKMARGAANSTPSLFSSFLYGLYLSKKGKLKALEEFETLKSKIEQ